MKKHLYIFKALNNPIYKIGVSDNVIARLETIKTMSPIEVTIYDVYRDLKDAMRVEKLLHKRFVKERSHGEWFILNGEQVIKLKDIITEYDSSSKVKINKRKLTKEYDISFKSLIDGYFSLLESGEFKFETDSKRKRPLIAERLGISDGNLGRLIRIHKSNPNLIDEMDKKNITINFAYQSIKNS